jgi:hypothetical protein
MAHQDPSYRLEKPIWSDADFAEMGWHDATLWSMAANPDSFEFLLDLDYIFQWVQPAEGETYFKFWVAPVTMVFENAHSIVVAIESQQGSIEIADLFREDPTPTPGGDLIQHTYRFECQEGEIRVRATGFKIFVRKSPALMRQQSFSLEARDGVSFSRDVDAI